IPFISEQTIMASVRSEAALGLTAVNKYLHANFISGGVQYYLPVNFTIIPVNKDAAAPSLVRLYVLDSYMDPVRADEQCTACSGVKEVYRLGVTKYTNANRLLENSRLDDNEGGRYQYIPYQEVSWVPYDQGYYAELTVNSFSEFWFNDGGPNGDMPLVP